MWESISTPLGFRRASVAMSDYMVEKSVAADGSRKYRFMLGPGLAMEAAYFFVVGRERPHIACVSTQLGCATGCPFCAAAAEGFHRNLTVDEIFSEISTVL